MKQWTLNLNPPPPVVPNLDDLAAQEIPVHAMESVDDKTLAGRAEAERSEARQKVAKKIERELEIKELYRQLAE